MTKRSAVTRVAVALLGTFLFITPSVADRPVKKNKDFNPTAAAQFPFVTTGVALKITKASVAKDGTIVARFTLTDSKGRGLDVDGIQTPGTVTLRFVAAYIPAGKTQYTAYTTTTLKSTINDNPAQIQASTDSGGTFTLVDAASGTYDYTFKTKAPANFDATATHTIGAQVERSLAEFGYDAAFDSDAVFDFVPNGSPVTVTRDIVTEATCGNCHNPIGAHGGARNKVAYCNLCHTPQSVNPDTKNTVDMKVFIHKLHMGSSLASVKAGQPYQVFHRGAIVDFSDIVFPQDVRNCTACHAASGVTKQADNWKTNPTREACGSCHENVNFATGENHVDLPQLDDKGCKNCHTSEAALDFDASIPGAHILPANSASLPGIITKVLKVDNATPGNAPTVTFSVLNKAGAPVDISKLTQIRVVLAGPNSDYQTGPGAIRVSEDPSKIPGTNGVYTYTTTNKIPAAATGSYTVSIQARNSVTLLPGTKKETIATDSAKPTEFYFSVDKSKMEPRRVVVASEKCNTCHAQLTFVHGGTRAATQECAICHNPSLVDSTLKQSVSFATQIHSIHRGENLANPYMLGTTNYQEVRFPGDLRVCTTCHVGDSYQVDNVGATAAISTPGGFTTTTPPISAACQGCHDDRSTAAHTLANTNGVGESCVVCHGKAADFAVDKVHARP